MFFGLFGKKKEEMAEMPMPSTNMGETMAAPAAEPTMEAESAMSDDSMSDMSESDEGEAEPQPVM